MGEPLISSTYSRRQLAMALRQQTCIHSARKGRYCCSHIITLHLPVAEACKLLGKQACKSTACKHTVHTLDRSSSARSSWGFKRCWLVTNSSSRRSQSLMRSILSRRSLHLALGVTVGSLVPRPPPWFLLRSLRPTLGGGAGGSHFFFCFWSCTRLCQYAGNSAERAMVQFDMTDQHGPAAPSQCC